MKNSKGFCWNDLVTTLKGNAPFLYYANPGNAGDNLIYFGMKTLFQQNNIEWLPFSEKNYRKNKRIVYSGGGNFVKYYTTCSDLIRKYDSSLEAFILLPHTISNNEELLQNLDKRYKIYCREKNSYAHCKTYATGGAEVHLSNDLAFVLRNNDIVAHFPRLFPCHSIDRICRWTQKRKRSMNYVNSGGKFFFRNDCEQSKDRPTPAENLDISIELITKQKTDAQMVTVAKGFLATLSKARVIHTDRLHVAIAGAIQGKAQVYLYPGSYHKNKSVYEHSIEPNFQNVAFLDNYASFPFKLNSKRSHII